MNYYITDTQAEANTQEASDYADYIANLPTEKEVGGQMVPIDNSAYIAGTTAWALPSKQRATDGKWVRRVCATSTATGRTTEALDTGGIWFPLVEA